MYRSQIVVPVAFLLLLFPVRAQDRVKCSADHSSSFRFSVTSRRNQTGHRMVAVVLANSMEYGSSMGALDQLTVDVEQGTIWCDGTETVSTSAQANAPPAKFRRPDYELFPGLGYYKMHTAAQTWDQARRACSKEGAYLLIVNSEAEAGVVKQLFARKPNIVGATWNDWIYVGFSDRAVEGHYVTVFGQALNSTGYTKWHSGQPDNHPWGTEPDQDCGSIHSGGTLQDLPCLAKMAYICEQEL